MNLRFAAEIIGWMLIACVGILGSVALIGVIAANALHLILQHYGFVANVIAWYWHKKGGEK